MTTQHGRAPTPAAWGIDTSYRDYKDEERRPPPATIEALLDAMDAQADGPPPAAATIVQPDADLRGASEVITEDGGTIPLDKPPPRLPLGYHDLVARDGSRSRLIVAPPTCHLPDDLQVWGWAVQLYSVHSAVSWGIGDLGDLRDFGRTAADGGAGMLLLNPLHAPEPGEPQQASPYYPSSRRWRNPLYLSIQDVPGASTTDLDAEVRDGLALGGSELVDRDGVYRVKMRALRKIWDHRPLSPAFEAFVSKHGDSLDEFATYMSLHEAHGGGPSAWPAEYRHPSSPSVARWAREHSDRIRFHKWVQWLLDEQLDRAGDGIGLVHDLAIGVDPHGADAWLWQDVFAPGVSVGAPPDQFNARGQNWGLPPFDPWKLRATGYDAFIQTIRAGLSHGSGLRIDHVMGLFRLFWLPEGASPADGTYVRYPHEDLLSIVALESERAGAFVVGEDLGTVERSVRDEMAARQIHSYRLMWFEDTPPAQYPRRALAAITNHDLPTVAGVWMGADLAEQQSLDLDPDAGAAEKLRGKLEALPAVTEDSDVPSVVAAAYRELASAPSALTAVTLEDALGVELRPNLPGTLDERPNWSMRLPRSIEEIEKDEDIAEIAQMMSTARATPPTSKWEHHYADTGEVRLHYVEAGEGPLVVLLHGFPDFWYSWRHQIPALAAAGFRVVAPDMRGYNESDKPEGVRAYGIDRLVEDVANLVHALGEERAHVVGHDWGGVVAWSFAMQRPDMLGRLVILNSPHPRQYMRGLTPSQLLKSWYMFFFQLPWLPELVLSLGDFAGLRKTMAAARTGEVSPEELDEYAAAAARSGDLHYPINYYRGLRVDPLGRLRGFKRVDSPVLVLWGDQDRFLEIHTADPGVDWADVTLRRFPTAGHWVHVEEPDSVNAALTTFLEPGP